MKRSRKMTLIPTNISKLLIPIGAAALAVALVMLAARAAGLGWWAAPEPTRVISAVDMPTFESAGDLSDEAEVVVMGTVSEVAGERIDYGIDDSLKDPDGADEDDYGIPVIFYEIDVEETLKGDVGSEIMVGKTKASIFGDHNDFASDLRVGETVLLFLAETTWSEMPRADEYANRFYVTVSMDNGVFDAADGAATVTDNTAFTPRMEHLFAQTSFTLGQVKQSVGVSDGDGQAGGPGGPSGPGNGGGTQTTN